jgi:hypothetical protein
MPHPHPRLTWAPLHTTHARAATSYHANDLSAANQTQRRLQAAELERMQQELAQLQQQLEIEASVRAAAVTCLAAKAAHHAESAAGWHTRREEDVVSKEREIEVGAQCMYMCVPAMRPCVSAQAGPACCM